MIVIHETFICKPGQASKMAKMFKEAMKDYPRMVHILTDMTGEFNKVVMVSKHENLAAYEKEWDDMMKNEAEMKKMQEIMKDYHEMYLTGCREIFKVW